MIVKPIEDEGATGEKPGCKPGRGKKQGREGETLVHFQRTELIYDGL